MGLRGVPIPGAIVELSHELFGCQTLSPWRRRERSRSTSCAPISRRSSA